MVAVDLEGRCVGPGLAEAVGSMGDLVGKHGVPSAVSSEFASGVAQGGPERKDRAQVKGETDLLLTNSFGALDVKIVLCANGNAAITRRNGAASVRHHISAILKDGSAKLVVFKCAVEAEVMVGDCLGLRFVVGEVIDVFVPWV